MLLGLHVVGTAGYMVIGGEQTTPLDALYMTFITIATIGYGEIIDLSHSPLGRGFTMALAFAGIANMGYVMSIMTAFIITGDLNSEFRRRRMILKIEDMDAHFIICGIGRVGYNVANELTLTNRSFVVVDTEQKKIDAYQAKYPGNAYLLGDASEDDLLIAAGVQRAAGVFAITGDDSKNLVITLTAKQLNASARVVARCHEINYTEKMKKVGADAIVSPDFTGGMRIASSMIRPQVVSFLDEMLRSDDRLRVEEVHVAQNHAGTKIGDLALRSHDYVVIAVRDGEQWRFNPASDFVLRNGHTLVVVATPEGRLSLTNLLS
ncbi:MAG: potassium channel protein [Betaproteobacteria bacterium]|nr:potassium channel protein [Betaproteobacteria bacterium]